MAKGELSDLKRFEQDRIDIIFQQEQAEIADRYHREMAACSEKRACASERLALKIEAELASRAELFGTGTVGIASQAREDHGLKSNGAPKPWVELSNSDKIERLRDVVKSVQSSERFYRNLSLEISDLRRVLGDHVHADGKVLVQANEASPCWDACQQSTKEDDPSQVYF